MCVLLKTINFGIFKRGNDLLNLEGKICLVLDISLGQARVEETAYFSAKCRKFWNIHLLFSIHLHNSRTGVSHTVIMPCTTRDSSSQNTCLLSTFIKLKISPTAPISAAEYSRGPLRSQLVHLRTLIESNNIIQEQRLVTP